MLGIYYRRKVLAKLNEAEQNVEASNAKCSALDKAKCRLQQEMEDLAIEVDRVGYHSIILIKMRIVKH